MIKQKELVPKRRFKGYKSNWNETSLGELVTIKSGWSPSNFNQINDENGSLFIKVDDLNYSFREQQKSNTRVTDNSRFEKMKKDSIIFPKRGAAILTNKVRITNSASYMDTNMMALEPENINADFLYTFIGKTGLYKIADTSTVPQINNKHIEPHIIKLPSRDEQQKIGQFFKHLDEMIAFEQGKIDKTKSLKSAYLAEMFPAEGERLPKRRFAGFTDEWRKEKLGNIGNTFSGLSGKTKKDFGHGDAEFITYLNVFNNPISNVNITENVEKDIKQDEVNYGDVLFTTSSETPHEVGMSSVWLDNRPNVYLNSFCFGYRINININYLFVAYLFRSQMVRKQMQVLAQGISRYNISKSKVMEITVLLPCVKEQKKIGEFFTNLDNIITTHQQKLEKLKATKQAYLHEMFV